MYRRCLELPLLRARRDGIRMVTHNDVSGAQCAQAADTVCALLKSPDWLQAQREARAQNGGLDEDVLR